MKEAHQILSEMKIFCDQILDQLKPHKILAHVTELDHACYRVASIERYETLKRELNACGVLLSEAFINGRSIATYKLIQAIQLTNGWSVTLLELPAPKPGKSYQEGFEHVELVTAEPLETLMTRFPQMDFDRSNFTAKINRDVAIKVKSGVVKFHESSLEQVIAEEQAELSRQSGSAPVVILDFDDTLVHSKEPFLRATHQALQQHLGRSISFQDVLAGARPTFPEFFANFGITNNAEIDRVIASFRDAWLKEASHCVVPVGVQSMLSCLKSEGIRVIVWTARDFDTTSDFIRHHNFDAYVESIYAFDTSAPSKPKPSPQMIKDIGGARCVVIGDSDSDLEGAKRLNAPFLQACWVREANLTNEVDVRCPSPQEALVQVITRLK